MKRVKGSQKTPPARVGLRWEGDKGEPLLSKRERARVVEVAVTPADIPPGSMLSEQTLADIAAGKVTWYRVPQTMFGRVPRKPARNPSAERRYQRRHQESA